LTELCEHQWGDGAHVCQRPGLIERSDKGRLRYVGAGVAIGVSGCALIDAMGGSADDDHNDAMGQGDGDDNPGGDKNSGLQYEEPRLWACTPPSSNREHTDEGANHNATHLTGLPPGRMQT